MLSGTDLFSTTLSWLCCSTWALCDRSRANELTWELRDFHFALHSTNNNSSSNRVGCFFRLLLSFSERDWKRARPQHISFFYSSFLSLGWRTSPAPPPPMFSILCYCVFVVNFDRSSMILFPHISNYSKFTFVSTSLLNCFFTCNVFSVSKRPNQMN